MEALVGIGVLSFTSSFFLVAILALACAGGPSGLGLGRGLAWVLSPWASRTFPVELGSTECPDTQLMHTAPVLAAMYEGWNLLPISILSVSSLRGLCRSPFTPFRRKAPLSSYM